MAFDPIFDVHLNDTLVGVLSRQGDTTAFQFDSGFFALSRRPTIGLYYAEDLKQVRYGNRALPTWFGHLLPEGRMRDLVEYSLNLRPDDGNRLEREIELFHSIGDDLPGAVRLLPSTRKGAIELDARFEQPGSGVEEDSDLLRFSVAGVGLKMSMLLDGNRFTAPARDSLGDWLIKMPDRTFVDLPRNEFGIMELARLAGLNVPETRAVMRAEVDSPDHFWSGEELAYAIERFDRRGGRRVHIEDFAQVRNLPIGDAKYSGSFETVARIAYAVGGQEDLDEVVRRLVFCYIVGNSDAHNKNWSLIYEDGINPRISPAYDIVSVVAYSAIQIDITPGLRLANRRRYQDVCLENFRRLARKAGSQVEVDGLVRAVVESVMDSRAILKDLWDGVRFDSSVVDRHMEDMAESLLRD